MLTLLWGADGHLLHVLSSTYGWGEGSRLGGLSSPCLLGSGSIRRKEFAEQKQYDFKTTIIYCASCHCKAWLKVFFLLRHSSFLLQALPLNSADILKRTGAEGEQWGQESISRQPRFSWMQVWCTLLGKKVTTVVAKGTDRAVDFGKKPVVFAFHGGESSRTEWYVPRWCYRPI